jgi:predicted transcriptional regulator
MAATKDYPLNLQPYVFHGVECSNDEHQSQGDCPFCGATSKFGINVASGQFRCVRCESRGNIHSFLATLWNESLGRTTDDDYDQLSAARDIPVFALKDWHFAKSIITQEWIVPVYNNPAPKGVISNLFRVIEEVEGNEDGTSKVKFTPMATPCCKLWPFGVNTITPKQSNLWTCEGLWDGPALYAVLATHKLNGSRLVRTNNRTEVLGVTSGVVGTTGAGNFSKDWLYLFKDKVESYLCYDNDHPKRDTSGNIRKVKGQTIRPGWDGQQRIIKLLDENQEFQPKRLFQMKWGDGQGHNDNLPDGFDTRDLIKRDGAVSAYTFLKDHLDLVEYSSPKNATKASNFVEPIERTTFEELCNDYKSKLHWSTSLQHTLATMLAVVFSTEFDGDQLWFRVIGPPGSGKSTLAEAISAAREYVMPKSVLTGFHSGFVDYDEKGKRNKGDASLIPKMHNKCMVMKDADTLINSSSRDRILGELRDIYDGESRAEYRNKVSGDFEGIRVTFILCGTDELRALNRTFLGERFLDCEIFTSSSDASKYTARAISNTYAKVIKGLGSALQAGVSEGSGEEADGTNSDSREFLYYLKQVTYGYIKYLKENVANFAPPILPPASDSYISSAGQFISFMRARVRRDGADLAYRPRAELATRLVSQLTKLSVCMAIVLRQDSINESVLSVVRKVVLDTSKSFQFEITQKLMESGQLSIRQLSLSLGLAETTIRKWVDDMMEFKIVRRCARSNNSGQRGRDIHMFELSPNIVELYLTVFGDPNSEGDILEELAPSAPIKKSGTAKLVEALSPHLDKPIPEPKRAPKRLLKPANVPAKPKSKKAKV